MTTPNSLSLGGSLNALSLSPDGSHAVVAGREVLKIVSLQDDHLKEVQNLRIGKISLNLSSVDARWHPQEQHKHMIATAATNGAVVIWNMNKEGQKQERVINEHSRTVNRIAWHPDHAFTLLSASQDGTMKLWDIRDPSNCKVTFDGRSEAVRDVQFSLYSNYFAAAFENGNVQIWDIRKHSTFERKITGHQGPVFCLDWNPEDKNLIATGGRDRFIQVWDLNNPGKPVYSIQTVYSVSHIAWRPGSKFQIVSSGLMDSKVHLWDIKKPYIPTLSFINHQDVVADIAWPKMSSNKIYTCGKDCNLMIQPTKTAYKPYEHLRTVAVSWTPNGDIALINDKINRQSSEESAPSMVFPSFFAFGQTQAPVNLVTESEKVKKGEMKVFSTDDKAKEMGQNIGFNHITFTHLAHNYKYKDPEATFAEMCDHNAEAAKAVNQHQISQVWSMLKLFFDIEEDESVVPSVPAVPTQASPRKIDSEPIPVPAMKLDPTVLPFTEAEDSTNKGHVSIENTAALLDDEALKIEFEDPMVSLDDELRPLSPYNYTNSMEENTFLSSDMSFPLVPLPSAAPIEAPPLPKLDTSRFLNRGEEHKPKEPEQIRVYGLLFQEQLKFDATKYVSQMLEYYADNGDVQTCVVMGMVLGERIKIDPIRWRHWISSYIELLHRLQLWTVSTDLLKKTDDKHAKQLNKKNTTVYTNCGDCNKPLINSGWFCEHCKKQTNSCSLCHKTVRGLYVWCQGCAHGGHLDHLTEWFTKEKFCPTGCGHVCTLQKIVKS